MSNQSQVICRAEQTRVRAQGELNQSGGLGSTMDSGSYKVSASRKKHEEECKSATLSLFLAGSGGCDDGRHGQGRCGQWTATSLHSNRCHGCPGACLWVRTAEFEPHSERRKRTTGGQPHVLLVRLQPRPSPLPVPLFSSVCPRRGLARWSAERSGVLLEALAMFFVVRSDSCHVVPPQPTLTRPSSPATDRKHSRRRSSSIRPTLGRR